MNRFRYSAVLLVALLCVGCAGYQSFSQQDVWSQAAIVGDQFKDYFSILYEQAADMTSNGTPAQKDFMRKEVNPVLNEAKAYLVLYHQGLLEWKQMGSQPVNWIRDRDQLKAFLDAAAALLIQVANM